MSIPTPSELVTGGPAHPPGPPPPVVIGLDDPGQAGPPAQVADPPVLADAVAAAVRAVPGVEDLHTGAYGEVATYLPGRRVNGVRLSAERCEVHVVLAWGRPLRETAAAIREAVAATGVRTPVDVTVEDVVDPDAASSARSSAIPVAMPRALESGPADQLLALESDPTEPPAALESAPADASAPSKETL